MCGGVGGGACRIRATYAKVFLALFRCRGESLLKLFHLFVNASLVLRPLPGKAKAQRDGQQTPNRVYTRRRKQVAPYLTAMLAR